MMPGLKVATKLMRYITKTGRKMVSGQHGMTKEVWKVFFILRKVKWKADALSITEKEVKVLNAYTRTIKWSD